LIIGEFKKSGLSQAVLARRLDKEPAQLSRLLSGPGNLTVDTISDLLFAINGTELGISLSTPVAAKNREIHVDLQKAASSPPVTPAPSSNKINNMSELMRQSRGVVNIPIPFPRQPSMAA
jgi:transcriptional regulator with XRE-family HTH domain